ncbi:MAG: hypothetical protein A2014_08730 [Spirochaetes bacterium GWF1_49_6]|nr:MAG: hypothetical protein A2014_08730 [Spirochaetes bacterium GWF1_49_6]
MAEILWTEEFFNNTVKKVDKEELFKRLKAETSEEEMHQVELNKDYPLFKDLFGVKIEYGMLRVQRIIMEDVLKLLSSFVKVIKAGSKHRFEPINNIEGIEFIAHRFGLEHPDKVAIEGYILNKELVHYFESPEYSYIMLKYKDNPENIFYIYKFYFTTIKDGLFLVIEKNI